MKPIEALRGGVPTKNPQTQAADSPQAARQESVSLGVSLDIARGLAALFVFCFHMSGSIGNASPALGDLARYGYLGVPIFFVISGYCMGASAHNLLRQNRPAGGFLLKRFLRIYPAFWASIVVIMMTPYVLAALSALKTGSYISPAPRWLALDSFDWFQFVTLTRVFFSNGMGLDHAFSAINIVYWTLAIEFQFYLVIYLALLWRRRFVAVLGGVTIASLAVFAYPQIKNTGLFLGYWPMFSLGLGLYVLLDKKYTLNRIGGAVGKYLPMSLFGAYILAFSMLAYYGRLMGVLDGVFRDGAFGFAVCVAIIFWFLSDFEKRLSFLERSGHVLVRAPLKVGVFLGSISYSIYLLHTKLYQIPAMAARQLTTPDSPAYILAVFFGTVALSWIFYLYFERPFISRRGLPRFSPAIAFLRPIKF